MSLVNVRQSMDDHAGDVDQAFDAIAAIKPEAIYFPAGVYSPTRSLKIPAETSSVFGNGADATLITASSAPPH